MKTLYQFFYVFVTWASLCAVIVSCDSSTKNDHEIVKTDQFSAIPELKERGVALGPNEETDNIFRIYAKAIEALNKDTYDMEARLSISEVFITEARLTGKHAYNYASALQVLDEVLLSRRPTSDQRFRALMNKATVKLSLHQFPEALALGNEALLLNNRNAGIYGVLTDANVEMGNYEAAVAMCDKMNSIRPDLRSYSRISYIREIHGDVEGAKAAMQMAVDAGYPGYEHTEWARITLGKLVENYGDLKAAEMHYTVALQNRPNYPYALAALGNIERKKGNFAKAEELINAASKYINEASFYEMLADVYMEQNFNDKAESDYKRALQMMRGSAEGDHGHSHVDGQEHIHLSDSDDHGHQHGLEMANLYLKIGNNLDAALDNAREEYKMRPKNIDVNKSLAMIYYQKGAIDRAAEHLTKALITDSKDPELLSLKGLIEIKEGNTASGKDLIRSAMKTNPHQEAVVAKEAKMAIS